MKQTTTSIKLTAKQVHVIARWLEENGVTEGNPVTITQSETGIGPGIDAKAETTEGAGIWKDVTDYDSW